MLADPYGYIKLYILIINLICKLLLRSSVCFARCGSLIVNFDIGTLGMDDTSELEKRLNDAVDAGYLGEFSVSKLSYDFRELGGKHDAVSVLSQQYTNAGAMSYS